MYLRRGKCWIFLRRPRIIAQITASSYFILFSPNQVSYYFSSSFFCRRPCLTHNLRGIQRFWELGSRRWRLGVFNWPLGKCVCCAELPWDRLSHWWFFPLFCSRLFLSNFPPGVGWKIGEGRTSINFFFLNKLPTVQQYAPEIYAQYTRLIFLFIRQPYSLDRWRSRPFQTVLEARIYYFILFFLKGRKEKTHTSISRLFCM